MPKSQKGVFNLWIIGLLTTALIILAGVGVLRSWYVHNLRPVSSSTSTSYFTVESGSTIHKIGVGLQNAHLIRSAKAFETYVRGSELNDKLQAGTYTLSPSMSVQQIAKKMAAGDVTKNLVTILPGKRLDEIKQTFIKSGWSQAVVDRAFDSSQYRSHPALVSLPAGATLEGYLYPDSFQKQADTPPETIVTESLDQMQKHLTPDIQAGFAAQGLSIFNGVTLASIVYQETGDPAYQSTVAQVFLSRIKAGKPLQSNVTANYAADLANQTRNVNIDSLYNTYLHPGLTPGPIGNVTA